MVSDKVGNTDGQRKGDRICDGTVVSDYDDEVSKCDIPSFSMSHFLVFNRFPGFHAILGGCCNELFDEPP